MELVVLKQLSNTLRRIKGQRQAVPGAADSAKIHNIWCSVRKAGVARKLKGY
jgi:hypothetical protein